nr:MAG TPA: hypothetical protein [Bacteriophage sp.]
MAVFTESYFEARRTYGAIMAGCQYELVQPMMDMAS